jgi:hypothetical protein
MKESEKKKLKKENFFFIPDGKMTLVTEKEQDGY